MGEVIRRTKGGKICWLVHSLLSMPMAFDGSEPAASLLPPMPVGALSKLRPGLPAANSVCRNGKPKPGDDCGHHRALPSGIRQSAHQRPRPLARKAPLSPGGASRVVGDVQASQFSVEAAERLRNRLMRQYAANTTRTHLSALSLRWAGRPERTDAAKPAVPTADAAQDGATRIPEPGSAHSADYGGVFGEQERYAMRCLPSRWRWNLCRSARWRDIRSALAGR